MEFRAIIEMECFGEDNFTFLLSSALTVFSCRCFFYNIFVEQSFILGKYDIFRSIL